MQFFESQVAAGGGGRWMVLGGGRHWLWPVAALVMLTLAGGKGAISFSFSLVSSHCFIVHGLLSCSTKAIHLNLNLYVPLQLLSRNKP